MSNIKAAKDLPKLIAGTQCVRHALQITYHLLKVCIAPRNDAYFKCTIMNSCKTAV